MKIKIENLGVVREGAIDLSKKLNIFCGPNGTGKTYMSYLIYGLLKNQIHVGIKNEKLIESLLENKIALYKIDFDELHKFRQSIILNTKHEFDSLFGIGDDLASQYFNSVIIEFNESKSDFENRIFESSIYKEIQIKKSLIKVVKPQKSLDLSLELDERIISNDDISLMSIYLQSSILSFLSTFPISSTFILPVERNSIFTFSKELSLSKQEAVDHFHAMTSKNKFDRFDLLFKKTTRYPLAIKDGLIIAEDLAETKKRTSKFFEFAEQIENELLLGKVIITTDGDIQFKPKGSTKKYLPIHMTASIVKSLASLVVYLKHIAKENDLIIIDEPEINLHPNNQIILTRLFARLINRGFRFLISTHSDHVIREINNLIMLGNNSSELKSKSIEYGYKEDEFLNRGDIEVKFFDSRNAKSKKSNIILTDIEVKKSGFDVSSISNTMREQDVIAEEFYYSIMYSNENESN